MTLLGFNWEHCGEPTPSPRNPCFGLSDVPWQELVGMFVNSFFPLSSFLDGRNMTRLAQLFPLTSDSFSGDRPRKKKKILICFNIVFKERDHPARFWH